MTEPDYSRVDLAPPWRSFVALDTETNGLDEGERAHPDPRVIELAAVRFDFGVVTRRFSSLIRTGVPIPPEATAINGVTDERCADAPTLAEAWRGVLALYDEPVDVTVAANGAFDHRFLSRDVKRARAEGHDIPKPPIALREPWIDVLCWMRHGAVDRTRYGKGNHTLVACCSRNGITIERAHSAEADAVAAGQLWLAIRERVIACVQSGAIADVLRVQATEAEKHAAYWRQRNGRAA